jgi:hypothetical protein
MYAVILNFESESIDVLDLVNCPEGIDHEEYIEDDKNGLDYSLSNCQWMVVKDKPEFMFLN